MRKERVKIGQYAILNRDLNKYWRHNNSVFKIASLPDETGMVKCDIVWNRNGLYNQIEVPYIHLKEFKDFDANFNDWKVGDILVPATTANKFMSSTRMVPIVITAFEVNYNTGIAKSGYGDSFENLRVWFSPASHKRDNSAKRYKGLFVRNYYKNDISVKGGQIIMPKCIVKNSPCYNQIIKELKDSGILNDDAKF